MNVIQKYCCLINGQNFLIQRNGVESKHGFYQRLIVQANSPDQARLLATTRIWHDSQLKAMTLNSEKDPPIIRMETIWELDLIEDSDAVDLDRIFYTEYKWWQFKERREEKKKLMAFYSEKETPADRK